ncbi:MAG: BatD family protein [Nitrospinaceae bacterium]
MNRVFCSIIIRGVFIGLTGLFFIMGTGSLSLAEEIGLQATVDTNELTLEDSLRLSITVKGVQNAPSPELPPLPNFRVQSAGTSSATEIVNGVTNVQVTYDYRLTPKQTGTFVIGPARLELAGIVYKSDPITVTVKKPSGKKTQARSLAYVETFVSNPRPFVNEQVIYTFKLYRRLDAKNLDLSMSFDDTDFRKEDMEDARTYNQVINGIPYQLHELSVALFPIHAGRVKIPAAVLELDLINRSKKGAGRDPFSMFFEDPFFASGAKTVHKVLRAEPIEVEVQPLPEKGRPPDFSNLVGPVEISAHLEKEQLEVGDSATLTVTVSGPGNVKDFSLPFPDLRSTFKVYPDQPEVKRTVKENNLTEEKIFRFALVPLKEGEFMLPPLGLSYFDPVREKYERAETRPFALSVLPSSGEEKLKVSEPERPEESEPENKVKIIGEDIFPIHTRLADFRNMAFTASDVGRFAMGFLFPPALFFALAGVIRHRQRLKYDVAFFRSWNAFKMADQRLKQLSGSPNSNPKEFVKELSEILREYIGNKLNLRGKAITSREVESKLKEKHYSKELASSVRRLLEKYESLQYGPKTFDNRKELFKESVKILKRLENRT